MLLFVIIRTFHERVIPMFLELYFKADHLRVYTGPQDT